MEKHKVLYSTEFLSILLDLINVDSVATLKWSLLIKVNQRYYFEFPSSELLTIQEIKSITWIVLKDKRANG